MSTPTKWGSEILVPTTTTADQFLAKVAALPNGRFLVVWNDTSQTGGDTSGSAIRGQYLNADGSKSGSEFLINEYTAGDQRVPSVAVLPDGRVMVTWQSQDFSGDQVGAIIGSSLEGNNGDFLINTTTAGFQTGVSLAALGTEKFIATWTDNGDIKAQILGPTGVKDGGEILVNSITAGQQQRSSVATFANGNFVVAWQDNNASSDDPSGSIRARLFSSTGAPLTQDFLVNTTTPATQTGPTVTSLADGRFVVTWTDFSQSGDDTSGTAVRAQVFNGDGSRSGGEFLVNTTTTGGQTGAATAALPDGRFVVVWCEVGPTSEVRGQVFTHEGVKSGDEFIVDAHNGLEQIAPSITVLADGRFVVSFDEKASNYDVRAQIFDPRETGINRFGTDRYDQYIGTRFGDHLEGQAGDDILVGGDGDDALVGGAGADTLDGGTGSDTVNFLSSLQGVQINLATGTASGGEAAGDTLTGIENLHGSNHADILVGDDRNNVLVGFIGSDSVAGGGGDDLLRGGSGGDILDGGAGVDTASYLGSFDDVTVDLRIGVGKYGDAENDVLIGIENVTGSDLDDDLYGDGGDNVLSGASGADLLKGGGGNDTLIGGLGGDLIDGGEGDDTAVFTESFDRYQANVENGQGYPPLVLLVSTDGTDYLTGIEHLVFEDGRIDLVDGIPLFDTFHYLTENRDVYRAGVDAFAHYNEFGWREGRDPSAFFDTSGYLAVNHDVAAADINPLDHYHLSGWKEGRDPSAFFDTMLYLIHNPDVAAAGIDPLAHYLADGRDEGRAAYRAVGAVSNGFDAQYYLFHNPDVAAAGIDPLFHFNAVGWKEGRGPNGWFDTAGYLSHYGDVAAAGINPFEHYMAIGWQEGRDASTYFDTRGYLAANPDVAAASINPLDHFLQNGIYEGRQAVNDGMWG